MPSLREPQVQPVSSISGFPEVPAADPSATVDPHWIELRGSSVLPSLYMPPAMPGRRRGWQQVVAVALVAVFLGATAAGVCLTYGPPLHGLW